MSDALADTFRWQTFFQHCTEPIFLVNRRRRLLFVNRAWENCTGLTLAQVRGRVCRRRGASSAGDREESLLSVLAPPVDAMRGQTCQVRRRAPDKANWWEMRFFPLAGAQELLGILGTFRVIAAPSEVALALPDKLMALRDQQSAAYRLEDLGGGSPALERLQEQARLASETTAPVAILGEAGVGKAWLARAIHLAGAHRQRYFACLDAERVPASLLVDVLFGPRSRQLGLGTVYLREPGCWPREWQSRLAETLRLRDNPDFPRIMAGFRADPREEIRAGRLVEEFYCAVSTITLHVPPVRERLTELPRFCELFLKRGRSLQPHAVQGVSAEALGVLRGYAWPGNWRELQDVLAGACRRAKAERIELADLPFHLKHAAAPPERRLPLDKLLEQVERRLIALAMKLTQNNHTRAAELLEIWRPRLIRRLEKFGSNDEKTEPTA